MNLSQCKIFFCTANTLRFQSLMCCQKISLQHACVDCDFQFVFLQNTSLNFFFSLSVSGPEKFRKIASPSSLQCSKLSGDIRLVSYVNKQSPTISHISAPSNEHIVTSKLGFSFFTQVGLLFWLNSRDFRQCMIALASQYYVDYVGFCFRKTLGYFKHIATQRAAIFEAVTRHRDVE